MIELNNAIKNICLNHTQEDTETSKHLIEMQIEILRIEGRLKEVKATHCFKKDIHLSQMINNVKVEMIKQGYAEETVEVNDD